jgi:uncharacterized caspase-like protein
MIRKYLLVLVALLSLVALLLPADSRAALVIGNSVYRGNPLSNPVNDATDIAMSLKDAGFDVILRTDQDLAGMEQSLADFQTLLKGKDTALFYYAGHGVQVDGENYLIPVKEDIQNSAQAKSRSVSIDDILDRVKTAGVKTALVFLDACRDNPFPGSSRSGTRGLAVVAAPAEVETCIAYATQPGNTAQDGTGRNGVFTAAILKNLSQPGTNLSDLMTSVIADVKATTGGKQQPRFDNGLSKPFYFVDPAVAAARAQAALDTSKAELATLDTKLADLQKQIISASDAQARQKLQVEQQRQQALQQAKVLEANNLAKEAARQKAAADTATQLASERVAAKAANAKAQNDLSNLASARRAELDKLTQSAANDNPDVLIDTIERLEGVLKEVDGQYTAALQKSLDASNAGWDKQLASISGEQPDATETDAEFAERITKKKAAIEAMHQAELSELHSSIEAQRISQTTAMRKQHDDTLNTLQTKVWKVTGSGATLTIGAFDRNARTWSFIVGSADPTLPMMPVNLVANLAAVPDPKTAILALDTAVNANALAAEFDWGITRDATNNRYVIDVRAVRVRNLTSNKVVAQASPNQRAAYFVAGKRSLPTAAIGRFTLPWLAKGSSVSVGGHDLQLEGSVALRSPILPVGAYDVTISGKYAYTGTVTITALGETELPGYRDGVLASMSSERSGLQKSLAGKKRKTAWGIVSLGTGLLGAAGAVTTYVLGSQAGNAYSNATDTSSVQTYRSQAELYGTLFPVAAAVAGLGLGISPVLLWGGPDPQVLQRSIDSLNEQIKTLGR